MLQLVVIYDLHTILQALRLNERGKVTMFDDRGTHHRSTKCASLCLDVRPLHEIEIEFFIYIFIGHTFCVLFAACRAGGQP